MDKDKEKETNLKKLFKIDTTCFIILCLIDSITIRIEYAHFTELSLVGLVMILYNLALLGIFALSSYAAISLLTSNNVSWNFTGEQYQDYKRSRTFFMNAQMIKTFIEIQMLIYHIKHVKISTKINTSKHTDLNQFDYNVYLVMLISIILSLGFLIYRGNKFLTEETIKTMAEKNSEEAEIQSPVQSKQMFDKQITGLKEEKIGESTSQTDNKTEKNQPLDQGKKKVIKTVPQSEARKLIAAGTATLKQVGENTVKKVQNIRSSTPKKNTYNSNLPDLSKKKGYEMISTNGSDSTKTNNNIENTEDLNSQTNLKQSEKYEPEVLDSNP